MVLFEQGFGDAMTIARNQLLPPNFFCQREGFAGEGIGFCPLLAVEGESRQIACKFSNSFLRMNILCNSHGFAVIVFGGGVVFVCVFCLRQIVQVNGYIIAFG